MSLGGRTVRKLWGAMLLLAFGMVGAPWVVAQAPPANIPGVPPGGMVVGPRRVDLAKPLILRDAGLVCEREDQIEAWIAMTTGSGRGFGSSENCAIVRREVPVTLLERKPIAGSHAYRIRIRLPSGRQVVGWTHIGSLRN